MQLEQQKYHYEVLHWASYISKKVSFLIQAHNNSLGIYLPIRLDGYIIILDNEQLWKLILSIVRPTSSEMATAVDSIS